MINVLAKKIYGSDFKDYFFEVNGSEIRTQDEIKSILKEKSDLVLLDKNLYKLIIIEEADGLTKHSQFAILDFMKNENLSIKFIFLCNDIDEIENKIKYKIQLFNFEKLKDEMIVERLEKILNNEKIGYENEALKKISKHSNGDMRIAINNIEKISKVFNYINEEYFYKFVDFGNPLIELKFFTHLLNYEVDTVFKIIDDQLENGYSYHEIILFFNECLDKIDNNSIFPEIFKLKLKEEIQYQKDETSTNFIQLYAFFAKILKTSKLYKIKTI